MILICYDGSEDAKAAIHQAARLFRDVPATILTIWKPMAKTLLRSAGGRGPVTGTVYIEDTDHATRGTAERCAGEGAQLASRLGLDARPATAPQQTSVAAAILGQANALGSTTVVLGSRGRGAVKSLLLGSVSWGVIQHADRPVIVVPSPEVAAGRAARYHHMTTEGARR